MMAGVSGLSDSPPLAGSIAGPGHNTNFKQQFSTNLENMADSTHKLTTMFYMVCQVYSHRLLLSLTPFLAL